MATERPARAFGGHERPIRGRTDEWLTPPEIIEALGPFGLDPCASIEQPWPTADRIFTKTDDGLSQSWEGFVWLNPPFGPDAGKWLDKLAEHRDGIALVAARTETRWFVRAVWDKADAILFLHGRLHFHYPDGRRAKGNSGVPICLVGYGEEARLRLEKGYELKGTFVSDWRSI